MAQVESNEVYWKWKMKQKISVENLQLKTVFERRPKWHTENRQDNFVSLAVHASIL
jgi:hypothetical protein